MLSGILNFIQGEPILIFIFGAAGAFVAEIINDNEIELPKKIDGKLSLGIFGGLVIGGLAGYFVDGSPVTAFMAGFAGKEFILRLVINKTKTTEKDKTEKKENQTETQNIVV